MTDNSEELRGAVRQLTELLLGDDTIDETLQRIADLATRVVPKSAMAGVSMLDDSRWKTVVSTDATVAHVDRAQYDADRGPCMAAARDGIVYRIEAMPREDRWPEFTSAANDAGILATISLPMTVRGQTLGALNLYAHEEAAFSPDDEEMGLLFAEQAAAAYAVSSRHWRTRRQAEQLEEALKSRDVIGQAKGIIMARTGRTADQAFDALREASQRRNVKLRDLADEVAMTGEIPGS